MYVFTAEQHCLLSLSANIWRRARCRQAPWPGLQRGDGDRSVSSRSLGAVSRHRKGGPLQPQGGRPNRPPPAIAIDHAQVTELHHALRNKPVMANKVVETLSRIYNSAEDKGLIPEGSNPCGLVVKNRERKSERFLTPDQFRRLGRALAEATTRRRVSPYAVAAIRLLILTGCRKREILHLRWEKVDLEAAELVLLDTKTGPRKVSLSLRAVRVLKSIPADGGQFLGDPGQGRGPANAQHRRGLGGCLRARRSQRHAHPRLPPFSFASRALALWARTCR